MRVYTGENNNNNVFGLKMFICKVNSNTTSKGEI